MTKDQEYSQFLQVYAQTIMHWQNVEAELCEIFKHVIQARHWAADAAFYSVQNINIRVGMIDAAADFSLSEDLLAQWQPLSTRIRKRGRRRNELAHFTLEYQMARPEGDRYVMADNFRHPKYIFKGKMQDRPAYDLKEIIDIGNSFHELFKDIRKFIIELLKVDLQRQGIPIPLEGSPAPEENP